MRKGGRVNRGTRNKAVRSFGSGMANPYLRTTCPVIASAITVQERRRKIFVEENGHRFRADADTRTSKLEMKKASGAFLVIREIERRRSG
jgi:hypothetical protein